MRFEHPAALWLLASALVPFFVSRLRPPQRRVELGSFYLWRDAPQADSVAVAPRAARDWLLVLLQVAAIAAIAVAAAQPVSTADTSRVAFVIDTSPRMQLRVGDVTAMDEARDRAGAIAATLGARARILVLAAGRHPEPVAESAPAEVVSTLTSITARSERADLASAIAAADAAGIARDAVYVFTNRDVSGRGAAGSPGDVHWIRVRDDGQNVRLTRLVAEEADGGAFRVLTAAANEGSASRTVNIVLAVDGREVRHFAMPIGPAAAAAHTERLREGGRVVSARITDADALAADNVLFAPLPSRDRIRVAVEGQRHPFVERALRSNPRVEPDLASITPADADVLVCDPCASVPETVAGLLAIAEGEPASRAARVDVEHADDPIVASMDSGDMIATAVAAPGLPASGRVLARAGGLPAIVASLDGGLRTVHLAFDVDDPAAAASVPFPIVLADAVDWLAGRDDRTSVDAGQPIVLTTRARHVTATGPDGHSRPVRFAPGVAIVDDTALPGAYVLDTPRRERLFVVNAAVDAPDGKVTIPAPPARVTRREVPISRALLFAALVLVIGQWVYGGRLARAR